MDFQNENVRSKSIDFSRSQDLLMSNFNSSMKLKKAANMASVSELSNGETRKPDIRQKLNIISSNSYFNEIDQRVNSCEEIKTEI